MREKTGISLKKVEMPLKVKMRKLGENVRMTLKELQSECGNFFHTSYF